MQKMNTGNFRKLLTIISLNLIVLIGCVPDSPKPESTEQEKSTELLKGTWILGKVDYDGIDISPNYDGFSLTFSDGDYQSGVAAGELFLRSGVWEWIDEISTNQIIMVSEQKEITIVSLSSNSLEFTFRLNNVGGSANGISGNYKITLEK